MRLKQAILMIMDRDTLKGTVCEPGGPGVAYAGMEDVHQ